MDVEGWEFPMGGLGKIRPGELFAFCMTRRRNSVEIYISWANGPAELDIPTKNGQQLWTAIRAYRSHAGSQLWVLLSACQPKSPFLSLAEIRGYRKLR